MLTLRTVDGAAVRTMRWTTRRDTGMHPLRLRSAGLVRHRPLVTSLPIPNGTTVGQTVSGDFSLSLPTRTQKVLDTNVGVNYTADCPRPLEALATRYSYVSVVNQTGQTATVSIWTAPSSVDGGYPYMDTVMAVYNRDTVPVLDQDRMSCNGYVNDDCRLGPCAVNNYYWAGLTPGLTNGALLAVVLGGVWNHFLPGMAPGACALIGAGARRGGSRSQRAPTGSGVAGGSLLRADRGRGGGRMTGSVAAELLLMRKRASTWILLGIIGLVAAFGVGGALIGRTSDELTRELEKADGTLTPEHRELDDEIVAQEVSSAGDQLQVKRLKKRKLAIKDRITAIEDQLLPDIIA